LDIPHAAVAFGAAFLAGAINSIAGGGTLVSFPTLIWLGLDSVTANATSTVAIWPGTVGSAWGYRRELRGVQSRLWLMIVPSLIGGIAGAVLLKWTPHRHVRPHGAVPDSLRDPPVHGPGDRCSASSGRAIRRCASRRNGCWAVCCFNCWWGFTEAISARDRHFDAGGAEHSGAERHPRDERPQGDPGRQRQRDRRGYFIWARMVYWPYVVLMAVASIVGGYGGAGAARKLGRTAVRRLVIAVGLGMAVSLFIRK
jgi:uncharacterized protein